MSDETDLDSEDTEGETPKWAPDDQLIASIMANGARTMADLAIGDRYWAVAGLTREGLTAREISERLKCCLRLVRTTKAHPMTTMCAMYMAESETFANEMRLAQMERAVLSRAHGEAVTELARTRMKLDNLLDAHLVGAVRTCSKGHPMTPYNSYECTGADGRTRTYCRDCHRDRAAEHRARKASSGEPTMLAASEAPVEVELQYQMAVTPSLADALVSQDDDLAALPVTEQDQPPPI